MLKCKANTATLFGKINAAMAALPTGCKVALQAAAGRVLQKVVAECPVDTGRLVNAYSEAAQQAQLPASPSGAGTWPRVTIRDSKHAHKIRERLQNQLEDLERAVRWVMGKPSSWQTRSGNRTGHLRPSAEKHLRRLEKAIERTREDLLKLRGTDILMKSDDGRARVYSTRTEIYGGEGHLYNRGLVWYCTIVNREPHAHTVEKMVRSFASAMRMLRGSGLRRVAGPPMLKRLRTAAATGRKVA
ncbi:MAG TPA: hypothetical protein VFF65_07605 [Phycisphaerales bacterium]|nr:hypothetical protein [Phycisphaerales bacterium]